MSLSNKVMLGLVAGVQLLAADVQAQGLAFTHAGTILDDGKQHPLKSPEGIACNDASSIVVADTGNGRLLTFALDAGAVTRVTELKLPEVTSPTRVRAGQDGSLLVLDRKTRRLARIVQGRVAGFVDVPGQPSGRVLVASFAVDRANSVYLLDIAQNVVWVVDAAGGAARSIALPKGPDSVVVEITVDEAGTVYALDAAGGKLLSAAKGAAELKPVSSKLKEVMSFPGYVTAYKGRLYVVDQNGDGIVMLAPDGTFLGRRLSFGWSEGLVHYPAQICFDDAGKVYVTDRHNNRVQSFSIE